MLNQETDVTFKYNSGATTKVLTCEWVRFGMEFIGDVEEDISFNLVEDYVDTRELIRLKVLLNYADTVWMSNFLKATDKQLVIDTVTTDVVNGAKRVDFSLFGDKSNVFSHPELRFKKKQSG